MKEFRVGDRVRYIGWDEEHKCDCIFNTSLLNKTGRIICITNSEIGVDLKEIGLRGGTNLYDNLKNNTGFWFLPQELELAKKEVLVFRRKE
jgi:hypothetical protein